MRWMDRVIIIRRFWIWLCVIEACQCPRNFRPPARILPIPECQRLKYFCLILSVVMNRPNTAVQLRLPHFVVAATSFNRVVSLWPAPGERQWSGKPTSRFSVGRLYLTLHCHHQNDSCIKMGSDKSPFNVSLTVRYKVTRQWWYFYSLLDKELRTMVFLFTFTQRTEDDGVFIHSYTKNWGRWCFYSLLHKGLRRSRDGRARVSTVCVRAEAPLSHPIIFISLPDSIGPPCYVSSG